MSKAKCPICNNPMYDGNVEFDKRQAKQEAYREVEDRIKGLDWLDVTQNDEDLISRKEALDIIKSLQDKEEE